MLWRLYHYIIVVDHHIKYHIINCSSIHCVTTCCVDCITVSVDCITITITVSVSVDCIAITIAIAITVSVGVGQCICT